MKIALTGASGFLGRALAARLRAVGDEVLPVRIREGQPIPACDAMVHLAGEPIAQRWTAAAKQRIRESRVDGTRRVVSDLAKLSPRPRAFVSASAVGIYGDRGDEVLTESSPPGAGFLAEACNGWEEAARAAAVGGTRVTLLRFSLVLGRRGGALQHILPPFRFGVGGRLGTGRQWMPWIHIDDAVAMIERALRDEALTGVFNAASPNPVTNLTFTAELARRLHRPAFFAVPAWTLRLALGEMAGVLLESQRAVPRAALDAGFGFRHPELGPALRDLLA